jgi:hypothetical protein
MATYKVKVSVRNNGKETFFETEVQASNERNAKDHSESDAAHNASFNGIPGAVVFEAVECQQV